MGRKLDLALGILNGAVGDHLARGASALATPMAFYQEGAALPLEPGRLARALGEATPRIVVLIHGVMATERMWQFAGGADYGSLLRRDLGVTPLYLRYNSGRAIAENGAALARLLERLLDAYPVPIEEICLLGHSMGGLVMRSACQVAVRAAYRWLPRTRRAIYVGTPHRGAPLERLGRTVTRVLRAIDDPHVRLVAHLGDLRSMGVKDLGDGDSVPLVPGIDHYLVAGSVSAAPWLTMLLGDAMVPVSSATDGAATALGWFPLPANHIRLVPGVGHTALARHPHVYEQIRTWCSVQ